MKTIYLIPTFVFLILNQISYATENSVINKEKCSFNQMDLFPRLNDKYKIYEENSDATTDVKGYEERLTSARNFNNQTVEDHRIYAEDFQMRISPYIQRAAPLQFLGNLVEDLHYTSDLMEQEKKLNQILKVFEIIVLNYKTIVRELNEDPFILSLKDGDNLRNRIEGWLSEFEKMDKSRTEPKYVACISSNLLKRKKLLEKTLVLEECLKEIPLIGSKINLVQDLQKYNLTHPGHAISPTGYLSGNKTTLISQNPVDAKAFEWYEKHIPVFEKHGYIENGVPKDVGFYKDKINKKESVFKEYEVVDEKNLLATPEQIGFRKFEDHPGFQNGIFRELIEGIRGTQSPGKKTIFIDIFFLGQTIGVVFAQELVEAIQKNKELKVFILKDQVNHYGHQKLMLPIYNYLRAFSELNPTRLIILPAELDKHPTGLADWMNYGFKEWAQEFFGSSLALAPMAKSDHSKIMVINGADLKNAVAYVSSKNWLDISGGVTFDEIIKLEGPAAIVVQDNYVPDMVAAFIRSEQKEYLTQLYRAQFSNEEIPTSELMSLRLIESWDILKRYNRKVQKEFPLSLCAAKKSEDVIVSVGENNHNANIRSTFDQNAYLISNSTKKIYVADQLFDDPRLIAATLSAAQNRNIGVDILLSSIPEISGIAANFPNILYLDILLKKKNIRLKWKKLFYSNEFAQEYHKKTLTGGTDFYNIHISGSANKDFMTMRGAFRETQLMIFQPTFKDGHPIDIRNSLAQQAVERFKIDFEEATGDFLIQPTVGENNIKKYNDNKGAVTATLDYKISKKSAEMLEKFGLLNSYEAPYKFYQSLRIIGDAVYNPWTFSLQSDSDIPVNLPMDW